MAHSVSLDVDAQFDRGAVACSPKQRATLRCQRGLVGRHAVTGLYEVREQDGQIVGIQHDFAVDLVAENSLLDVLTAAAMQHQRVFGSGDHVFVESVEIDDHTIRLGMGS